MRGPGSWLSASRFNVAPRFKNRGAISYSRAREMGSVTCNTAPVSVVYLLFIAAGGELQRELPGLYDGRVRYFNLRFRVSS